MTKNAIDNTIKFLKDNADTIEAFSLVVKRKADFETSVKTCLTSEVDGVCFGDSYDLVGVLELAKLKLLETMK